MRIALIGNQNSGKSTLFNLLTGAVQTVGNWPGVTIERREGKIKGTDHTLLDLPGIYSLSPYTEEEKISRNVLFSNEIDIILNIIDSTQIERSLYLTSQLLELDIPILVILNMSDIINKNNAKINVDALSKDFNTKVVQISATKKKTIVELVSAMEEVISKGKKPSSIKYDTKIEKYVTKIENVLTNQKHKRFTALDVLSDGVIPQVDELKITPILEEAKRDFNVDLEELVIDNRYNKIEHLVGVAVDNKYYRRITDSLDKVFLNKFVSIPIFALIMAAIYFLAAGFIGSYTVDLVDGGVSSLIEVVTSFLESIGTWDFLISLVCDGILTGVGAVLNFVPQLIILFLCISFLETTGYMSRIAFILDKLFNKIGLSGKSIISFIVGSGCSVPGIMSARTIKNDVEKKTTIVLTPFFPCSAKLPIIALFIGSFFAVPWLMSLSLYFLSIVVIIVSAFLLNKFYFKVKDSTFLLELPTYKLPSLRHILKDVFEKVFAFIKRAGTIILLCSVVVWFLLSFSITFEYGVDVDDSILALIGKGLSWIFYPALGELSWEATVCALQGLVAKEQVVGSMEIIANMSEGAGELVFTSAAFSFFTPMTAYAFAVFNLFSAPCFGAIGAMRRELGSKKSMFKAIFFQTGLAYVLASIIGMLGWVFFK
ncbi:MAG: ferrous iron transport protein B [Acholeplasmatales bacterium]|jgi:ferrous iron transport protein B|nr:ferrous iron transport protein B [Acholeplasmatales bacterium]